MLAKTELCGLHTVINFFYKQLILNDRPADLSIDRKDSQYLMETINIYSFYPLFMLYYKYLDDKNLALAEDHKIIKRKR